MLDIYILSNYGHPKRAKIRISTYFIFYIIKEGTVRLLSPKWLFTYVFVALNCFPPPSPISGSVVTVELLSSHKMAEIRPATLQRGAPGSENEHVYCHLTVIKKDIEFTPFRPAEYQ